MAIEDSLFAAGRRHWRAFAPAWAFPVVFFFGGLLSRRLGYANEFFFLLVAPLFFGTFFWSMGPSFRKEIKHWHSSFWSMFVPFLIFGILAFGRVALFGYER